MHDYTLENMIVEFGKHSEEYMKIVQENPSNFEDGFNLPHALFSICKEIQQCKAGLHIIP